MTDPHNAGWESWLQKWFVRLLIPAILVNAGGLLIDILEPDGALYATIAKTIAQSGDFVNLYRDGADWLDKPHFPFWMAALSFRMLGINGFAYKFPALLFWGIGAWYTWRLALSIYGKSVAQLSTLIYVSAAHLVISNNDVRAEPYLTGLIIGSVYHFYKASRAPASRQRAGQSERLWLHLAAGSLFAGAALMTKGPFALLTIAGGLILDWAIGGEWSQFRAIRWWIAIVLTALFTLPEIYCLYIQFDCHPEKHVFNRTGVSGVRWFFWDSQFGRFFNTGPIKGSGDPFFYFHTILWAFLPWSILLYAAVIQKCRGIGRTLGPDTRSGPGPDTGKSLAADPAFGHRRLAAGVAGDWICLGSALSSFILFSLSRFQLPHYLNILFPFFSILTAGYLYGIRRKGERQFVRIVQGIINGILPVLLLLLCWFFHFSHWPVILAGLAILSLLPFLLFRGRDLTVSFTRSFWLAMLVFAFINFGLYPAILQYQAGTQAGRWIGRNPGISTVYIPWESPDNFSFEFYSPVPVRRILIDSLSPMLSKGPVVVFAPVAFADTLAAKGYHTDQLQEFPNFHISQLTGEFLNYKTRSSVLEPYALTRIRP